ncbi:ciliary microtubule inner protein 2B [Poecilia reticulata]|uniref:Ciliary microtubule inner protein 2B n=1 Tax=Poecilia reticulata TaxID=8081 RepID=A0A3P9NXE9_POERE|nr:PREDICTED: protein FAM166B [Poecilia reticulata]
MSEYAPEVKSFLPAGPSYIPGYTGHCPGLKFTMGKPYGMVTSELLSQRARHPEYDISRLSENIPDNVFRKSIPGFTGFIPRSRNYYGCNYNVACKKAQTEVYLAEQVKRQQQSKRFPSVNTYGSEHLERAKSPVTAALDKVFVFESLHPFIPPGNPYQMEDDNPKKYFIPGFTGHVPFAHNFYGKGFSITTNQALQEYGKQQKRLKADERDPTHLPMFHSSKKGVIPGFTGHIPGYKFMVGGTAGRLTEAAFGKTFSKFTDP